MGINTETYIRKPLYVEAVRITEENFDDIANWVPGRVQKQGSKRYIKVMVANPKSDRQTKAYVGDWILWTEKGGHKVYTPKAFELAFDKVEEPAQTHEYGPSEPESQHPVTEELEVVPATPTAIAQAATASHEARLQEETANDGKLKHEPVDVPNSEISVADSPTAPPVHRADGRRVLSVEEQRQMGNDAVREMLRSGDVVLAQDLTEHVA
jgi:hypothetical protein